MNLVTWKPQSDSVNSSSINLSGELPNGVVELYTKIVQCAGELNIDLLVVGATARDLVLAFGYGAQTTRGTRDIDFGINITSWDQFYQLTRALENLGFKHNQQRVHQLLYNDTDALTWEIDIVPFGGIADENHEISWPPSHNFTMSTLGFHDAYNHALTVQISETPVITIPVASPAGIAFLKLIAWVDRFPERRAKDAIDFLYIIQTYAAIPEVLDTIYEPDGCMEAQEWDEPKACAMKLGQDIKTIAHQESVDYLKQQLFDKEGKKEQFTLDMTSNNKNVQQCTELLNIFIDELTHKHS